jgi:glycerol-3-phosphate dehydrogenase
VVGAEVEDRLTGNRHEIRARLTVNATGPWAQDWAPAGEGKTRLRRTQGAHLIVPERLTEHAVVLLARRDGRVFFVVPWQGRTMIGTTDLDFTGDPAEARPSPGEARYLLEETRRIFPEADLSGVEIGFAGVRPLLPETTVGESQVTREHRIVDHAGEGTPGLLSVFGGKLTTARAIAQEVVDHAAGHLREKAPCRTGSLPLHGGDLPLPFAEWVERLAARCRELGLPEGSAEELAEAYGSRADEALALVGEGDYLLFPDRPLLNARLVYGVRREMALTTSDLLLRRTLTGYGEDHPLDMGVRVAMWLGHVLERSSKEVEADLIDYSHQISLTRLAAQEPVSG